MAVFRYTWRTAVRETGLVAAALVFCVPVYILVVDALKSNSDIYSTSSLSPPKSIHLEGFSNVWNGTGSGVSIGHALLNSTIITVSAVALLVLFGSVSAFSLARRDSRLAGMIYLLFVAGIIVPYQLGLIPLYASMKSLGLTGRYLGVIVLHVGLLMPLTVFLYTGFIRALPRDYEEAAQVDGASSLRTLARVVFPLLRPITGTVAVLTAVFVWNDFFLSLIFLGGTPNEPLPVAIYSFTGEFVSQWNLIFAAVIIAIAPILVFYLFAQKRLIQGFSGGIRG
jgi:raffinose/stachyose/melibiose transport system permease protein